MLFLQKFWEKLNQSISQSRQLLSIIQLSSIKTSLASDLIISLYNSTTQSACSAFKDVNCSLTSISSIDFFNFFFFNLRGCRITPNLHEQRQCQYSFAWTLLIIWHLQTLKVTSAAWLGRFIFPCSLFTWGNKISSINFSDSFSLL